MASPLDSFNHGLASGDPYANSVILWSRITPEDPSDQVEVSWEASTTTSFDAASIVDSGVFTTNAERDWTVKVEAGGLSPDTTYYYRFQVGDQLSAVGQTKTLPVGSDPVRLAVFSCANFTAAEQFAAYGRAAAIHAVNPYDALLHLGDYIYEYGPGGYGAAEDAAADRGFLPNREIVSLDDYRERYAQYHTDQNLQALRAAAPLIAIWDDHETANDSWADGAENHQNDTEGSWTERRDAALKAYYEWLPIREPLLRNGLDQGTAETPLTQGYRSFSFGDVLALHVLETRLSARDEQLAYPDAAAVQARIGAILADPDQVAAYASQLSITPPADPAAIPAFANALAPVVTQELVLATVQQAWGDPERDLIGDTQMAWLQQQMASSDAAWQVLGQQVLMQSMAVPAELLLNPGDPTLLDKYAAPLQKLATGTAFADLSAAEQALFAEAGKIPYNLDAWDGYGVERETILQSALALGKRLISLAGDTHNAWAGVLDTMNANGENQAGTVAGVEFATPGVTSPGFEQYLPGADAYLRALYPAADGLDGLFTGYVNGLEYADLNRRGFLDLTVTSDKATGNFVYLDGIDPLSAQPLWASEAVIASSDFDLAILPEAKPHITWQPEWSELDLVFGLAVLGDGSLIELDPSGYATLPRSGVQLADVTVSGSEASDQIFAGIGSVVKAAGGSDTFFNSGDTGENLLIGGDGTDHFFLAPTNDKVVGGSITESFYLDGSAPFFALPDQEPDKFYLLVDEFSVETPLSVLDYEPGLDQILVDGVAVSGEWMQLKASLAAQGFLINAIPSVGSIGNPGPIRITPGRRLELSASELGTDPDGDALSAGVLSGPSWISSTGNTLVINAPEQLIQADLTAPIQIGLNDGKALVRFNLELVVDPPTVQPDTPTPPPTTVTPPPTTPVPSTTPVVQAPAPGSTVQTVDSDNDGLREVETAPDGQAIDGNNDGIPDAQQATVAGFRFINDGASSSDFGALEVAAGVQLQFNADPLITASADGAFSFTGKDGVAVSAVLPQGVTNRFAGVIGFEVTNVAQGGSTDVTLSLPRTIALTDPSQSAYLRYNYLNDRFEEFVDAAGSPLYTFVDRNADGVLDGIQLTLVDGDLQWDGDGKVNGRVKDPGTLVDAQRNLIGNNKANRLLGNVLANIIDGRGGKDTLIGYLGNDILKGRSGNDRFDAGEGADLIIGGGGADRFIYRSLADSTVAQSDTIRKLSGKDRFDLRHFDTDVKFTFIDTNKFSGTAGELRTTRTSLQADLDGDGSADFRVNFTNTFRLEADQLLL